MCELFECLMNISVWYQHPLVVERFYEEMGLVSSAIAFSWSKWNAAVEAENICVQCTEALRDEPLLEVRSSATQREN